MYDLLIGPFAEFGFMQRALLGAILLSLSACPVGVFLMLRRMGLAGDAISHAVLPGVAVGFLMFGLELIPMTIGGLIAGLAVALGAGAISRVTALREDTSLAAFYLISLALGVMLVSLRGSSVDLMHVLFGTVLALDSDTLVLIGAVCVVSLASIIVFWRALVAESLDPLFLRSVSKVGAPAHFLFLALVVLNLVSGFQALGTLLSVGLMMVPAAAARFWVNRVASMCVIAVIIGMIASVAGLLISYHASLPSGPSIILSAGVIYIGSIIFAPLGLIAQRNKPQRHRVA